MCGASTEEAMTYLSQLELLTEPSWNPPADAG